MKKYSMTCWALVWAKEGSVEYMPEIFYSRSAARKAQKEMSPKGKVVRVSIKERKNK